MTELRAFLKMCSQAGSQTHRFVLEQGREFKIGPKTFAGKRGKVGYCYMNSALKTLADDDLIYCEGYTVIYGIPIEHAWCCTKEGELIDPTLKAGDRITEYYGVPFTEDYLLKTLRKNGVYGLLGFMSSKTVRPLIEGKTKNFREEIG